MGDQRGDMLQVSRACWLAVLVSVVSTGLSRESASLDDGILDDLSVDRIQDPGLDGSVFHQDEKHMAPEDMARASKVFDVLFGTDDEPSLGESAGNSAQAVARKQATKALLKAKSSSATKKAEKALKRADKAVKKAKMKVVGKNKFKKLQKKKCSASLPRPKG